MRWLGWILFLGCGRAGFQPLDADAGGDAWLTGYSYRKAVTAWTGLEQTLTDFPISVVVTDPDLAAHANAGGTDIRFAASDGMVLPHELVSYSGSSGALETWLRVPALAPTTELFLYYGGPAVAHEPAAVWSGFGGVWHMDGSGSVERDSTGNENHAGATIPATQPLGADGVIGRARAYDGADDSMSVPDPPDGSLDFGTGSFTVSLWVYVTTSMGEYDIVIHKGAASAASPGYDMELGFNRWAACIGDGVDNVCADLGTDPALLDQWVLLALVVDRSTSRLYAYANGLVIDMVDIGNIANVDSPLDLSLGRPSDPYRGVLDEIRILPGATSAHWLHAQYDNVTRRAQWLTFGPEERY